MLLLSGAADPVVPADNAARMAAGLKAAGAAVDHRILAGGHGLGPADLPVVSVWVALARAK